ncbi:MAG: T9SS type A sorting domain-containing protein [Tannerellaceae bacterium]|nr:T9SS type A sorting domain-containing protein [Tannerellaceae bacterium]
MDRLFSGETPSGTSVTLAAHSFKLFVNQKGAPTSNEKITTASDLRILIDGNRANIICDQQVQQVSVFSVNGSLLKATKNTKEIDLSGIENGILLFVVRTNNDVTSRFVKK